MSNMMLTTEITNNLVTGATRLLKANEGLPLHLFVCSSEIDGEGRAVMGDDAT